MKEILINSFQEVDIPLLITDSNGKIKFINNSAEILFNLNSEKAKKDFKNNIFFYDEAGKKLDFEQLPFMTALKEKKSISENKLKFIINDNSFLLFDVNSIYVKADCKNKEQVITTFWNVTDKAEFKNKLNKSDEKFHLLNETADELIFILNNYGYFVTVNSQGAKSLGYLPDELIGKHFLDFVSENNKEDIAEAFQKILKEEDLISFNVQFIDKFEKELTYKINARNLKDNKKITGLIGIGQDVTDIINYEKKFKELNSKLIEANRMISIEQDRAKQQISVLEELNKLKNEFISNVSHELRTPLASIVGFAETIVSEKDLSRELLEEFSSIILSEGKRLARLINDILDFSNLETDKDALERTDFDIIFVLNELADKWRKNAEEKGLTFSTEIPENQIIINADKERINTAVTNLLSNAVKFTNKGGRITLMARDFLKEIEIIVSDTGVGIPKEDIPKLFQKFSKVGKTKTQISGAGFGLALVKQIVDLHDGLVKILSELNKGSTFVIKLPKSRRR